MAMTDPTLEAAELAGMKVRLPRDLHAAVGVAAKEAGMSMNTWVVRQLAAALEAAPTPTGGRRSSATATFLAELTFTLSGAEIDTQAHRLTEQMVNMTELAGGSAVGSRIMRTVPIQPRTP